MRCHLVLQGESVQPNVNPKGLKALVVCRLITLDKCPGVRPIGKTSRCIIGIAVLITLKVDIREAVGLIQLVLALKADVKLQYMLCMNFLALHTAMSSSKLTPPMPSIH